MTREELRAVMEGGKHHEVAKAWLASDDAVLQFQTSEGKWIDKDLDSGFYDEVNYRIKPKTLLYRVARFSSPVFPVRVVYLSDACKASDFVDFIDKDWKEVEV